MVQQKKRAGFRPPPNQMPAGEYTTELVDFPPIHHPRPPPSRGDIRLSVDDGPPSTRRTLHDLQPVILISKACSIVDATQQEQARQGCSACADRGLCRTPTAHHLGNGRRSFTKKTPIGLAVCAWPMWVRQKRQQTAGVAVAILSLSYPLWAATPRRRLPLDPTISPTVGLPLVTRKGQESRGAPLAETRRRLGKRLCCRRVSTR